MNSVSFPIQLVTLIRRLVNVISTISLTNHYLLPRNRTENRHRAKPSVGSYSLLLDPSLGNRWDWWRTAYNFGWSNILKSFRSSDSRDGLQLGLHKEYISASTPSRTRYSVLRSETSLCASESHSNASISMVKEASSTSSPNVAPSKQDTIHRLMSNPALFDPIRTPRYPIVLCHGLYGFDTRGPSAFPSLRYHYWSNVLSILKKKIGAEVIVTSVPGTGSIAARAEMLDRILQQRAIGRGVNLMAHSMGGLDCRHLITHIKPTDYVPLSLTSISTPHRGSPFMDWCAQNLGLGRRTDHQVLECNNAPTNSDQSNSDKHEFILSLSSLPSSFTTLILSYLDSPAYANLTTSYLNDVFNPSTPDDPRVKYFSVVSRIDEMNIWHPLWLPKMVLDDAERKAKESLKARMGDNYSGEGVPLWEQDDQWGNDGLVTVQSARWGEFLGILEGCDHWDIRSWRGSSMEFSIGIPSVSIPLGGLAYRVGSDGWSFGDWARFIGAWRKQDKGTEDGLRISPAMTQATDALPPSSWRETKPKQGERGQSDETDPVVKASTDRLSAVFDWIVEQVPPPGKSLPSNGQSPTEKPVRKDLVTKADLERFYVSLTRKLYDEGL